MFVLLIAASVIQKLLNLPPKFQNRRLAFLRELPADAEVAVLAGLERQEVSFIVRAF